MKTLRGLLAWTNGKKTIAGLSLFFIIGGFKQIGFLDLDTLNQFEKVAEALVAIGIIHKVKKEI